MLQPLPYIFIYLPCPLLPSVVRFPSYYCLRPDSDLADSCILLCQCIVSAVHFVLSVESSYYCHYNLGWLVAGSRRGIGVNEERDQTLNQLLTELDGFEGREGVLLLAATNRAEVEFEFVSNCAVLCCNTLC